MEIAVPCQPFDFTIRARPQTSARCQPFWRRQAFVGHWVISQILRHEEDSDLLLGERSIPLASDRLLSVVFRRSHEYPCKQFPMERPSAFRESRLKLRATATQILVFYRPDTGIQRASENEVGLVRRLMNVSSRSRRHIGRRSEKTGLGKRSL